MMKPLKPLNITNLISSWLSISMIFLIGEVVIRFGVFSSLVIVSAFIIAFLVSLLMQKPIKKWSLGILKDSFMGKIISALRFMEVCVLNFFVVGLIFQSMFQMSIYVPVFSTAIIMAALSFCQPYLEKAQISLKNTKFVLVSVLAIVLPSYIYLQKGLESLYHNLLYYQPHVLNHESKSLWLLFLAAFFIFFSKLLFQGEGLKYLEQDFKKGISKLLIAVFIFCAFIMAFATMNIVAITQNLKVTHANELFILLIEKLSPSLVFPVFCFFLYFITLIILMDAVAPDVDKVKNKKGFNVSFALIFISAIITTIVFQHSTLLFIYGFFGLFISILIMTAMVLDIFRANITRKSR